MGVGDLSAGQRAGSEILCLWGGCVEAPVLEPSGACLCHALCVNGTMLASHESVAVASIYKGPSGIYLQGAKSRMLGGTRVWLC